ncbi:MAG: VanZ family protein [Anaerolineae bacterium]|nr:VanZ family protein [Anaerolineae bacterium]
MNHPTAMEWLARALGVAMIAVLFVGAGTAGEVPLFPAPWDKLSHLTYFYLLSRLMGFGFRWSVGWVVLCGAMVGLADELHQVTLAGRDGNVFDWLADVAGASLAAWVRSRRTTRRTK